MVAMAYISCQNHANRKQPSCKGPLFLRLFLPVLHSFCHLLAALVHGLGAVALVCRGPRLLQGLLARSCQRAWHSTTNAFHGGRWLSAPPILLSMLLARAVSHPSSFFFSFFPSFSCFKPLGLLWLLFLIPLLQGFTFFGCFLSRGFSHLTFCGCFFPLLQQPSRAAPAASASRVWGWLPSWPALPGWCASY